MGEENVADGLTKHAERAKMDYFMKECGFLRRGGRHELCPKLGDDKWVHVSPFTIFSGSHGREDELPE